MQACISESVKNILVDQSQYRSTIIKSKQLCCHMIKSLNHQINILKWQKCLQEHFKQTIFRLLKIIQSCHQSSNKCKCIENYRGQKTDEQNGNLSLAQPLQQVKIDVNMTQIRQDDSSQLKWFIRLEGGTRGIKQVCTRLEDQILRYKYPSVVPAYQVGMVKPTQHCDTQVLGKLTLSVKYPSVAPACQVGKVILTQRCDTLVQVN